jgi:hypothetical protein
LRRRNPVTEIDINVVRAQIEALEAIRGQADLRYKNAKKHLEEKVDPTDEDVAFFRGFQRSYWGTLHSINETLAHLKSKVLRWQREERKRLVAAGGASVVPATSTSTEGS